MAEVERITSMPDGAYEIKGDARKVSSVVLQEEYMEALPEPTVRYIDVPKVEEVIKYVVKKEVREVERVIPKYVDKFVDKYVDVPKYVDEIKEVEKIVPVEVIKKVPRVVYDKVPVAQRQDVRVERRKAELTTKTVEGETIEVPKTVVVHKKVPVSKYKAIDQQLIVAQTVKPIIVEGAGQVHVDVTTYEPELIPVDIHVAKFVDTKLVKVSEPHTEHKVVSVPPAQYNSMLKYLNRHLTEEEQSCLPYIVNSHGQITFMNEPLEWKAPVSGISIRPLPHGTNMWSSGTVQANALRGGIANEEAVRIAKEESRRNYEESIRMLEIRRMEIEQKMADYNAAERQRAEQEVHRLNAQFEQEYQNELQRFREMNLTNEQNARHG